MLRNEKQVRQRRKKTIFGRKQPCIIQIQHKSQKHFEYLRLIDILLLLTLNRLLRLDKQRLQRLQMELISSTGQNLKSIIRIVLSTFWI